MSARGRWISLRPLSGDDIPVLFRWHSDLDHLHLWNHDRRLYALENFSPGYRNFVSGAIVVLIFDRDNQPIGFARAHDLNFADGWLRLTLFVEDIPNRRLEALEAGAQFIDYLFSSFPLRKIYAGAPEYDVDTLAVLERAGLVVEGRDREHVWHGDRYWDVVQLALFRTAWESARTELVRLAELQEDLNAALGDSSQYEARVSV